MPTILITNYHPQIETLTLIIGVVLGGNSDLLCPLVPVCYRTCISYHACYPSVLWLVLLPSFPSALLTWQGSPWYVSPTPLSSPLANLNFTASHHPCNRRNSDPTSTLTITDLFLKSDLYLALPYWEDDYSIDFAPL